MKPWNKPIRFHYVRSTEAMTNKGLEPFNPWREWWGVTSWMVGTCKYPWSPWIQIHFGKFGIQVKWYLMVGISVIGAFVAGILV